MPMCNGWAFTSEFFLSAQQTGPPPPPSASLEPGMFLFTNPGARRGLLLEAGCLLPYYTRLLCGSVSKKEQHCYMYNNQQGEFK